MKRVVVTGASGMIGATVCRALIRRGDRPVALSRDPARSAAGSGPDSASRSGFASSADAYPDADPDPGIEWHAWSDPLTAPPPAAALEGAHGIIHLLGEPVSQRWSAEAKRRIHDSRVLSTRMLVAGLAELAAEQRPAVLVSQSATGYYGPRGTEELDEHAAPGHGFLAGVVAAWEQEALSAAPACRVAVTRTGVVISPAGGALAKMLPFFRAGVGGPVAGGRQYVPWIHVDDVVAALLFCLDTAGADGPVNVTAPRPVDNAELSRALGRALHRPALLPVPAAALKLLYGEMSEIVTTGQRAIPARLQQLGFGFLHPDIEPALRDVLA